jgi:hypothetical protein
MIRSGNRPHEGFEMIARALTGLGVLLACVLGLCGGANAQLAGGAAYMYCQSVAGPPAQFAPCSGANPLSISGSLTANLAGFQPAAFTNLTATGSSSSSTALPTNTGSINIIDNGTTSVSCTLAVASATGVKNNIVVAPGAGGRNIALGSSGFANIACIDQGAADSTSNPVSIEGGSGLGTGWGGGGGSSGGGGLSVLDGATFTAGTSSFTPGGCEYNSSPTTLASGAQGTFACTTQRALTIDTPTTNNALYAAITSQIPACTSTPCFNIGNVYPAINVTLTDCSGTITTGGTAQNAFSAQTTLHGWHIENIDAATGSGEPIWINETGTAAAATAGSDPLPAPAATTFTGMGSYYSTNGTNHAPSIIAATSAHKYSCKWW